MAQFPTCFQDKHTLGSLWFNYLRPRIASNLSCLLGSTSPLFYQRTTTKFSCFRQRHNWKVSPVFYVFHTVDRIRDTYWTTNRTCLALCVLGFASDTHSNADSFHDLTIVNAFVGDRCTDLYVWAI